MASYFLGHSNDFAFCTLDKIAATMDTSTTSVIRFCRRLGFADASIKTKGGTLRVAWRYIGDEVRYDVSVPEGTVATLALPDGSERTLAAGEYLFVN